MARTCYIWHRDNIIAETDGAGEITAQYNYAPEPHGELISQRRKVGGNWQTRVHHYDPLGSTVALTDESGNVSDTYKNDAWGNPISTTGTSDNPFRWLGRYGYYWDQETESYDIRRRDYKPTIARWLSEDPLGLAYFFEIGRRVRQLVDNPVGVNMYAYVSLRPTFAFDPSGLTDHHWFKQYSGRGQGEVKNVCCGPLAFSIHEFTSDLGSLAKDVPSLTNLHYYMEHVFHYPIYYRAILDLAIAKGDCCWLVAGTNMLRQASLFEAAQDGFVVSGTSWHVHYHLKPSQWTEPRWWKLIDKACKDSKFDPQEIFRLIKPPPRSQSKPIEELVSVPARRQSDKPELRNRMSLPLPQHEIEHDPGMGHAYEFDVIVGVVGAMVVVGPTALMTTVGGIAGAASRALVTRPPGARVPPRAPVRVP